MRRSAGGLSVTQQVIGLHVRYPGASIQLSANRLTWEHALRPTDVSREYRVRLRYRSGGQPRVWVVDDVRTRGDAPLPHTYADGTLCLYRSGDWTRHMQLADTIVPWTAEWLAFYEMWLVEGEWHGGGEWPPLRTSDSRAEKPCVGSPGEIEKAQET